MATLPAKVQRWLSRRGPFEFRHVYPRDELKPPKRPPFQQVWFRLSEPVGDAPELHHALLAYASDFQLLGTATFPHGISYYQPNVQMASLDHALWFHRPFRVDDWLLYSIDSPSAQDARGLARGQIFTRDGRLVASTAQEGLIRVVPGRRRRAPAAAEGLSHAPGIHQPAARNRRRRGQAAARTQASRSTSPTGAPTTASAAASSAMPSR